MQVLLMKVPPPLSQELERRIQAQADGEVQLRHAQHMEELPDTLPPGLIVLGDSGGALEELAEQCRQLHARRSCSRTQLTVLSYRKGSESEVLGRAGADECVAPPGEGWGMRLLSLRRRLQLDGKQTQELDRLEQPRLTSQEALYVLLSSTSADIGHGFFQLLVSQLTSAFRVSVALVAELSADQETLHTLALWNEGRLQPSEAWPLHGTPHQQVLAQGSRHITEGVRGLFPEDANLRRLEAEGYLGMVLKNSRQQPIGVLAVAHRESLQAGFIDYALLGALGNRTGAELERIHMQSELERARDFLHNTLDALPEPVFVKDRAHRFVAMNGAFCRALGKSEDELLGTSDYDMAPAHEAALAWNKDEELFSSGQPSESEETLTDRAGSSRIILTKKAPFTGAGSEPFIVGVIRDVTESRRLEMQLRLADRMASVGMLAAGVAHEINNPLAFISSNLAFISEQLAQEVLTPQERGELRDAVRDSLEGTARMRVIIQDLKSFSRADDETQGEVDIHRVIQGALRLVRNEFHHRARLTRSLEPVPPVRGNEARLGQVIVNLLVNALQAFPAERSPEQNIITISTRSQGAWVHIEVEDNGLGMSPEVQQRIFEPFYTTKPVGVGTGLGLSICNNLIQIMGGVIEVHSKPSWGSTFRLVLPAFATKSESTTAPVARPEAAEAPRRRVLLIDDELAVGTAVRRLLKDRHEVDVLQDAREALKRIADGARYDAIVCDVMMQEMNGVQFFEELERRAPELARHTGLMSGGVFNVQAREFIEHRAIRLLQKPFEREGLRKFVERLCVGVS